MRRMSEWQNSVPDQHTIQPVSSSTLKTIASLYELFLNTPPIHQHAPLQPQTHPVETNDMISQVLTRLHSSGDCIWMSEENNFSRRSVYTFGHSYWRHELVTKRWARNGNSKILHKARQNCIKPERAIFTLVDSTRTHLTNTKPQQDVNHFIFSKSHIWPQKKFNTTWKNLIASSDSAEKYNTI